ncbi:MAG: hypothetical protein K0S21_1017, partial [Rhizobiaceae bacterium]|nr:hypothetical protein [Rhizobiaceae bacterium]
MPRRGRSPRSKPTMTPKNAVLHVSDVH